MKILLLTTLLVGLLTTSLAQLTEYTFDCDRPGDVTSFCKNTGSNCNAGTCACGAGFTGTTCEQLDPSTDCAADTALVCTPNGVCAKDAADVDTCFCNPGYAYDATENKCASMVRVSECTSTQMTMVFQYYGDATFTGSAVVSGATDPLACALQPSATYTNALELTLPFTGSACGDAVEDPVDAAIKIFEVEVQYDTDAKSDKDQVFAFPCKVLAGGESQVNDVSISSLTDLDPLTELEKIQPTATSSEAGLTVTLLDASGATLTGAHAVGTEVTLRFSLDLTAGTGFLNFHVNSVTATASGTGAPTKTFVTTGCAMSAARSSIKTFTRLASSQEVRVDMNMGLIKFVGFPDLIFKTDVKLCQQADCSDVTGKPADCTSVTGAIVGNTNINNAGADNYRRKRQATNSGDPLSARLNVSTIVTDGITFYTPYPQEVSNANCMQSLVFLLPLILLSVMLVVAMLCAVYFCLKLGKQRKYEDGGLPNMSYKN